MKNIKILTFSILFSFTAYSQTNKELAKEETIKMIKRHGYKVISVKIQK